MECQCRTPSCRGTIGGRDWQRPDLQRKYGTYFSSYLLRRLAHQPTIDADPDPSAHSRMPSALKVTSARLRRSALRRPGAQIPRAGSQVITQNSLNGVVRYHVVRAPAGSEAISPAETL
jgi:hypothetical protein